ncbi:MAG: hypothetical protein JEZ00_00050 [Anaerolineaceae bacterium]|nr:hypothetical protein [Anaerolineaceae bacterium]
MKYRKIHIFLLITIISLISLACKISLGGNEPNAETIPVSADAADSVQSIIDNATITDAQNQTIAFTVTEEQVTSYAAQKFAENPDSDISNPQIYLRDGKIDAYAVYTQEYFDINMHITLSAIISPNNELEITVDNADLGPIPVSEGLLDSISSMIDDTMTNTLLPASTGFRMETIYIADGMATISGTLVP